MTMLFMGGEMSSFLPSDSSPTEVADPALAYWDSTYARCAMRTSNGSDTNYFETTSWTSQTSLYFHAEFQQFTLGIGYNNGILYFYDGADYAVQLKKYTDDTFELLYHNGVAWVSADTAVLNASPQSLDIFIDTANGILRAYFGGTKRMEATGLDLSNLSGVTKASMVSNYYMSWSQVVVDTNPTIGGKLWTAPIIGDGATSQFAGTWDDIDEIVYDDGTFISSGTNGHVSTFEIDPPDVDGYVIQAVGVYARVRCGAGGPQNFQPVIRSGGTNYPSGVNQALDIGFEPHGYIWETDPDTGSAWLFADFATAEPGVKAIT